MRLIDADAVERKLQEVLDLKRGEEETPAYVAFEYFIEALRKEPTLWTTCWHCGANIDSSHSPWEVENENY